MSQFWSLIAMRRGKMKKVLICAAIFVLVLARCDQPTKTGEKKETILTISNSCSRNIRNVKWNSTGFGSIGMGDKVKVNVDHGSGSIYFVVYREISSYPYWGRLVRTQEILVIEEGKTQTYVLHNNTVVVDIATDQIYKISDIFSLPFDGNWEHGG
jgi:hypothetical protein